MMSLTDQPEIDLDLDTRAEAFERAWGSGTAPGLNDFLPPVEDSRYPRALCELIRIDLEMRWKHHQPKRLALYQKEFPQLFRHAALVRTMVQEEYRLRVLGQETIDPAEYERTFNVCIADLPKPGDSSTSVVEEETAAPTQVVIPAQVQDQREELTLEQADFVKELRSTEPLAAARFEEAIEGMPRCGQQLFGFRLFQELGTGSFAKVFLAHQAELADRPVALKVAPSLENEPRTLARMQHTNIVPIYSVHRNGPLQAVCMPYLGANTLAGVVRGMSRKGSAFPESGRHLLSTLFAHHSTVEEGKNPGKPRTSSTIVNPLQETPGPASLSTPILDMMCRFNHVEAVLWIGARLADGLAHAHERGILHLDLKPANVLITDEGQPMLLDFNLSIDLKGSISLEKARMGGTLPYMPPEQLEALGGGKRQIDGRCDLFALGVILFELLTGKTPFPIPRGYMKEMIPAMIADRRLGAPSPRMQNAAISPAVDAMVRKLLDPDAERRYQSAAHFREDAERQLADLPLKYAPDRSPAERIGKWRRRHPRLAAATLVGLAAFFLLIVPATVIAVQQSRIAQRKLAIELAEAQQTASEAGREARTVQALLATRENRDLLNRGIARGQAVLGRYGIGRDADWSQKPLFNRLSPEQQHALRSELGEMLLLMCRGEQIRALDAASPTARQASLASALNWNHLAEECYPSGQIPALLARQRKQLLEVLPAPNAAGNQEFPTVADDPYHLALAHVLAGRYRDARDVLYPFTRNNPQNFQAWFLRGHCHDRLGQYADSIACWDVCIAIEPDTPWAWYNRGVVLLHLSNFQSAEADFTRALQFQPDWLEATMYRAIARKGLKDYAAALADMNEVLRSPQAPVRGWFLRAEIAEAAGHRDDAARDRAEGMKREPKDELSWSMRGYARMTREPRQALQDIEQALALNPASREALLNQSIILSEFLDRPRDAIGVLDRFLEFYPDHVEARAGRGVLLARVGECDRARRDAASCLLHERTPFLKYQLAGLFAQLSRHEQGSQAKDEALQLLGDALRSGFTDLDTWKSDHDLDPVRALAEFQRLEAVLAGLKHSPAK